MSAAAKPEISQMSDAEIVEAYLTASMIPDPDAAAAYMKPGTIITFTGGREFDHPRGPTGFNAQRYRSTAARIHRNARSTSIARSSRHWSRATKPR